MKTTIQRVESKSLDNTENLITYITTYTQPNILNKPINEFSQSYNEGVNYTTIVTNITTDEIITTINSSYIEKI